MEGKTVSISSNDDGIMICIRPDEDWFQKMDTVFGFSRTHDLADEFTGIKNYKTYKTWVKREIIEVTEIDGCRCYIFFGEKKLSILMLRHGTYKKILHALLEQFPLLQPTTSTYR